MQRFFCFESRGFQGCMWPLGVEINEPSVISREYGRLGRKRVTAKALSVLSRHRLFTHSSSLSSTQMGGVLRQKTPGPKRVNGCLAPAILPLFTGSSRVNVEQQCLCEERRFWVTNRAHLKYLNFELASRLAFRSKFSTTRSCLYPCYFHPPPPPILTKTLQVYNSLSPLSLKPHLRHK
jgi:hypothetical protein